MILLPDHSHLADDDDLVSETRLLRKSLRLSKPSVFLRIMTFDIYKYMLSSPNQDLPCNQCIWPKCYSTLWTASLYQLRPSNSCACIASNGSVQSFEVLPCGFIWIHIFKVSWLSWLFCFETTSSPTGLQHLTFASSLDEMGLLHWRNSQGWKNAHRFGWKRICQIPGLAVQKTSPMSFAIWATETHQIPKFSLFSHE